MSKIGRIWGWAAGIPLFVLVLVTIVAVIMRYLFNSPLQSTEEISGLMMIWIVMIGGIAAERDGQHLAIPLLPDALPRRAGLAMNIAITAFSVVVLLYMAYLAWQLAGRAQYKLTQILGVSWFWIDIAVTVGTTVIAAYMVLRIVRYVREFGMSDAEAAAFAQKSAQGDAE
jgi:TRAP-type C4-dicarboxylate transport system permease small subunit